MAKTKKATSSNKNEVTVDRRSGGAAERRKVDRRAKSVEVAEERRNDDRRKSPRRRQIDPTTCERDYTDDEIEFMHSMDEYKRRSGRMFPTCSEILEVMRDLGYRKLSAEQLEDFEGTTIQISADALTSDSSEGEEEEE